MKQSAGTALPALVILLVALGWPNSSVAAERAATLLRLPRHVQAYQRIIRRLNCPCGCHQTLGDCVHTADTCTGVVSRLVIEELLVQGFSEEQVLRGFVQGFKPAVMAHPRIQARVGPPGSRLHTTFRTGFGPEILYREPSFWPVALTLVLLTVAFAILVLQIVNRRKVATDPEPTTGHTGELPERVRAMLDKLEK